jgi:hypothetical protein
MALQFSIPQNVGSYVGSTQVWDVNEIYKLNIDQAFKELLVRLYQNINNVNNVLNLKTTGLYPLSEFVTSGQFFPDPNFSSFTGTVPANRQIFRTTVNTGALAGGAKAVAHGIPVTSAFTFIYIGGVASDQVGLNYYPFNYANSSGNDLRMYADGTNINIVNNTGINFTASYVVLEYIKT